MKSGFHEAVGVEGKVPVEGYNSTILKSTEGKELTFFYNRTWRALYQGVGKEGLNTVLPLAPIRR